MTDVARLSRSKRVAFALILLIGTPLAGTVVIEGLSSLLLIAYALYQGPAEELAERRHTTYDSLLGWVNMPGVSVPDMYGPGVGLTINDRGFRGTRAVAGDVPPGGRRIICSGDSFTLGYGVSDSQSWCARLERELPGVETLNMGQGGYGIDQAYLWYRRDGAGMAHQLQLFAFIYHDFERMKSGSFMGVSKPILRVEGERLEVGNVPVPRQSRLGRWLNHSIQTLATARSIMLLRALQRRTGPVTASSRSDSLTWQVAEKVFEDLAESHRRRGTRLVLVYLPTRVDLSAGAAGPWREHLAGFTARTGIPVIDLTPELGAMPADSLRLMFIRGTDLEFPGASGHYTSAGNAWVARQLARRIEALSLLP